MPRTLGDIDTLLYGGPHFCGRRPFVLRVVVVECSPRGRLEASVLGRVAALRSLRRGGGGGGGGVRHHRVTTAVLRIGGDGNLVGAASAWRACGRMQDVDWSGSGDRARKVHRLSRIRPYDSLACMLAMYY